MVYNFEDVIYDLESFGLTDVLLPFLLIFTIVFAVLQKINIFGVDKKRFNVILALVLSLLVVIPHVTGDYPMDYDVVDVINESLPSVALLIVAIVMGMLLLGMFGAEAAWKGPITGWVVIAAAVVVFWIFGGAMWGGDLWDQFVSAVGEEVVTLVIIILVFGIIIALITGEGKESKANLLTSIGEKVGDFFGRK